MQNVIQCRGGDGGDASPPTSLKVTILAKKSASISNNSAPFRDASPPTDLNVTNPAKKSQFWWKPFFFFFFGDHLNLGEKNVWISDFGRKITLNFGEDIRIFEVLCFKSPPPPKFSGSATANGIKIAFTSKNYKKIAQRLRAWAPEPKASSGWLEGRPQTPVCDTFEVH